MSSSSSASSSPASLQSTIPLRYAPPSPSAISRDVARAYVLTPPPEDSNTPGSTTVLLHGKCILKIRDELDDLRTDLGRLQPNAHYRSRYSLERSPSERSPSYQSWYDDFHEQLEDLKTTVDSLNTKVEEIETGVSDLYTKFEEVETVINDLRVEFDEFETQYREDIKAVDLQLQLLQNGMIFQRNALVSRFHDVVTPLAIATGNRHTVQQEKKRPLKWYWKLHDERRTSLLVQQHEFYQIQLSDWLDDNFDDSEDDDSDDLDRHMSLPNNLEDAVRRYRERAVRVLFSHLGLPYQYFEDLAQRGQTGGPVKRGNVSAQEGPLKRSQQHVDRSGSTKSDLGSTTQPFTSPTQSGLSGSIRQDDG